MHPHSLPGGRLDPLATAPDFFTGSEPALLGPGRGRILPAVNRFFTALVLLGRRRYAEVRDRIRRTLARAEPAGRRLAPGYHVALAACGAAERDWRAYDRHLCSAREIQESTGLVDIDVAGTARLAGDLAFARHRITRAREAWQFALLHWRALDRADEMLALERLLAQHTG